MNMHVHISYAHCLHLAVLDHMFSDYIRLYLNCLIIMLYLRSSQIFLSAILKAKMKTQPEDFLFSWADFSKSFLKHWRLIHPRCTAPELCIASARSEPESREVQHFLGRGRDPEETQVTTSGRTENQGVCVSSRRTGGTTFRPLWQLRLIKRIIAHLSLGLLVLVPFETFCPHTATSTAPANMKEGSHDHYTKTQTCWGLVIKRKEVRHKLLVTRRHKAAGDRYINCSRMSQGDYKLMSQYP